MCSNFIYGTIWCGIHMLQCPSFILFYLFTCYWYLLNFLLILTCCYFMSLHIASCCYLLLLLCSYFLLKQQPSTTIAMKNYHEYQSIIIILPIRNNNFNNQHFQLRFLINHEYINQYKYHWHRTCCMICS